MLLLSIQCAYFKTQTNTVRNQSINQSVAARLTCRSRCVATLHCSAPVYRYLFEHATENWYFSGLGATHGVDLAYVFGVPIFGENFTVQEAYLSDWTARAFGNFSHSYKPPSEWNLYNPSGPEPTILGIDLIRTNKRSWRATECAQIFELFL